MPKTPIPDLEEDDAQHAVITDVQLRRRDDGRISFLVKINSRDVHFMTILELSIPTAFEENVEKGSQFDPSTLPEDDDNGRQQTMFRRVFGNRKYDAWLQRLVFNLDSLARTAGRDPSKLEIIAKPKCLEDYAHNLHLMLSGVECIMLRRGGEVWDLIKDQDFKSTDKKMRGYKVLWEKD